VASPFRRQIVQRNARSDRNFTQAAFWFVISAAAIIAAVLPSIVKMSVQMERIYISAPALISILILAYLAREQMKFPLSEQHAGAFPQQMSWEK